MHSLMKTHRIKDLDVYHAVIVANIPFPNKANSLR
jgi:hypothetical protein